MNSEIKKLITEPYLLIGIPFVSRGRDKSGLDCYGLIMEVYRRLNIKLPEYAYSSTKETSLLHLLIQDGDDIAESVTYPQFGDIVTISIKHPYVHHLGFILNENQFIHAIRNRHVCIESLGAAEWKKRIRCYWRFKKDFIDQCRIK